jgi:hypothetical protein
MSSFHKLLDYMLHDKDRLFDNEGHSFVIAHNLKGDNIEEWEKQLRENEQYRLNKRSDSVLLTHEIISWHKDDAENISLEKLEDMARKYIRQRNPNGMYVAVPHFDKEHYHVHICASGIEYRTGKGMRLAKKDLQILKQKIQQYQIEKYPELNKSIVKHGAPPKEQVLLPEKEYQFKQRTGRATGREQISVIIKTCYKSAESKEDFFMKLNECGLATYIRGKKTTGIIYENKKYRLKGLGYSEQSIENLDRSAKRQKEISRLRDKNERDIHRDI